MREDQTATFAVEQYDVIGLRAVALLHPGGTNGHAGYREAGGFRPLGQQAFDVVRGHMPFDHISIHDGCVAGLQVVGDAEMHLRGRHILKVGDFDAEACLAQMIDPCGAAAAIRRLEHPHLHFIRDSHTGQAGR